MFPQSPGATTTDIWMGVGQGARCISVNPTCWRHNYRNFIKDVHACWAVCGDSHAGSFGQNSDCAWWRHQMETFSALPALYAGIHWSPVISPHKGQQRGALMFSLICVWTNGWVNDRNAGDLRRHRAHYGIIVMGDYHPAAALLYTIV